MFKYFLEDACQNKLIKSNTELAHFLDDLPLFLPLSTLAAYTALKSSSDTAVELVLLDTYKNIYIFFLHGLLCKNIPPPRTRIQTVYMRQNSGSNLATGVLPPLSMSSLCYHPAFTNINYDYIRRKHRYQNFENLLFEVTAVGNFRIHILIVSEYSN